jgi:hypothetical protein
LEKEDRMVMVLNYQPMVSGGEQDGVGPQPSTMVDRENSMLLVLQYQPMAVGGE